MNFLIIGSGGREHALAAQIRKSISFQSPSSKEGKIFVTPGNGGTASCYQNLDVELHPPFDRLIEIIKQHDIGLVIVGPEDYLSMGIVDYLENAGIKAFGPSQDASQLESSKSFAKEVMNSAGIPTARFQVFSDLQSAKNFLQESEGRWVLKADGLCAGKGVIIPETKEDAIRALDDYFISKKFGSAGKKIVIEEFIKGQEASVLAFSDGKRVRCLPVSQDHKRIFDNDQGPNTGGMGVYSPVPFIKPVHQEIVEKKFLLPTLQEMEKRGMPFKGILYAGLMIDGDEVKVVEFNVRFGDPECQCVLSLLDCDFKEVILACIDGCLDRVDFKIKKKSSCTVVMVSGGYPDKYEINKEITGLEKIDNSYLTFHAGTNFSGGKFYTNGGRVLSVTAIGDYQSLKEVISNCYRQIAKIDFKNAYFRKDIGSKGIS